MSGTRRGGRLTANDKLTAAALRWLPWLAFLLVALPLPLYLWLTQAGTEDVVAALFSLAAGSVVGLIVALALRLYRGRWERGLRDRLAVDGVTADELSFFASELRPAERRALKQMDEQNPLLADAYRETLASRVTAARVLASARREAAALEGRMQSASRLEGQTRKSLEDELNADRERLARVERETAGHEAGIEARLQMIEALAGRGASVEETELALNRLDVARDFAPLGLVNAQSEFEARRELEAESRPSAGTSGAKPRPKLESHKSSE